MQPTIQQAIEHMERNCAFTSYPEKRWNASELAEYQRETGIKLPQQLAYVLREIGECYVEENDGFVAERDDGTRSVHNTQVLVGDMEWIMSTYELLISKSEWPDRLPGQLVIFGSADGGNAYLMMDGTGEQNNAVYLWARATDPWGTGDNATGLEKVADSLFGFFYNLKPEEDL
jgi:hypothetical protein